MTTAFRQLFDDLRVSFRLAKRHFISYFLASIGLLIFAALVLFGAVVVVLGAYAASGGLSPENLSSTIDWWANADPVVLLGTGILIVVPVGTLLFLLVGAMIGMSKDLTATGETGAERPFTWIRHRGKALLGTSFLLTLVLAVPPTLVGYVVSRAGGGATSPVGSAVVSVFVYLWVFVVGGLMSMSFPAVAYGERVIDAVKGSPRLVVRHFERVFGLWTAFMAITVIPTAAASLGGTTIAGIGGLGTFPWAMLLALELLIAMAVMAWFLIVLPMLYIGLTRIYAEVTGKEVAEERPVDIPIL